MKKGKKETPPDLARLCYVAGRTAWFTTQDLRSQWGDDWGTPPYEAVAGMPYRYTRYDKEDGLPPWEIMSVEFEGDFLLPFNPPAPTKWSVGELNAGARPWLRGKDSLGSTVEINAGVSVEEFRRLVALSGGSAF